MRFFPILLLTTIFAMNALDASAIAFVKVEPAGKFKAVEQYDVDAEEYEKQPLTAKRYLSYLYISNTRGKVVESWDLTNDSAGSYYRRHVFTYDRLDRTNAELTYQSAHAAPNQYFSVSRSAKGIKLVPDLADSLESVTITEYNGRGDVIEIRTTDAEGILKQKINYAYDSKGNQISFHNVKGDGTILCDTTTVYLENGWFAEQTYHGGSMGGPSKIITRRDGAGRNILEEQFFLGPEDVGDVKKDSLILTSRAITTYTGKFENLDWTIWSVKGEPQQRLLIVDKGDDEISRKEFTPDIVPESGESATKLTWVVAEESVRDLQFDKAGNPMKETVRTRKSPNQPFHYSQVFERVITYF